jgi:hypothetical protein
MYFILCALAELQVLECPVGLFENIIHLSFRTDLQCVKTMKEMYSS